MQQFDWSQLLRVGLTQLRLKPADFWALTPVELMIMLGPQATMRPMDRTGLEALLEAYPDTKNEGTPDGF
ncbi:phage tail assembly chaperone [Lentibacter algarum]|uniref:rcc01693 family protein n=1 Tax=Lentibacter algarum TaxID=576131 RepID=UPI001C09D08B|nr:rcc01693 family protein [Lentibacter algarum]MBU2982732.1 phage tail assembly chaperone [Lentibacter algarum]